MKYLVSFVFAILFATLSYAALPMPGQEDFQAALKIAQSTQSPMSVRWQALIRAADLARAEQIDEIKIFAKSKEWYMRNAALVALEKMNINHALDEAQILLKDKALVVRSAAVDVIANRYTMKNRDLLAAELSKPYNFRKKQSLWIRPKIFNVIAAKATADDRGFLTRSLFDSDKKIALSATQALQRVTNVQFDSKNETDQIQLWQSFVKKNGWL